MKQMGFILATKYIKKRKLLLRGTLEEHVYRSRIPSIDLSSDKQDPLQDTSLIKELPGIIPLCH